MAYELRPNSGNLFRNDKGDNPARPDYCGEINVEGRVWKVSGWLKDGRKGKYLSLAIGDKPGDNDPDRIPF